MTSDYSYNQSAKKRAREQALSHAVDSLTLEREQACCVRRTYVREIRDALLTSSNQSDQLFASRVDDQRIESWERLHQSNVSTRSPGDLTVCYLAGPEPLNDFRILRDLGVHPHNIWAFGNDKDAYDCAIESLKQSEFPMLKLYRGSIESFFVECPKQFDIIYIDACGPLPSVSKRKTLRIVATALRHRRLASPGVLITNFSGPPNADDPYRSAYSRLVASYLYSKEFIEGYPSGERSDSFSDGPISHGLAFDGESDGEDDSFFQIVSENLEAYYGQFVTRQLMDLASHVIPWQRFCNSGYYKQFFGQSDPKDREKIAHLMEQTSPSNGLGGESEIDYKHLVGQVADHPSSFAIHWTIHNLENAVSGSGDHSKSDDRLISAWLKELSGRPDVRVDAVRAMRLHSVFQWNQEFWEDRLSKAVGGYDFSHRMFQFCDVPMANLGFDLLVNQLGYPYHYATRMIKRWRYTAKSTPMFLDAFVLDECRYVYDWLPTIDLLASGLADKNQQLVYRFALDGLGKKVRWYNNEYFTGSAVIDQFTKGFEAETLDPRELIIGQ